MANKSDQSGSGIRLLNYSGSSEADWIHKANSRLYTPARIRRRATIQEKFTTSDIFVSSGNEGKELKSLKLSTSENFEVSSPTELRPDVRFGRKPSASNMQFGKKTSSRMKLSFISVENVFSSRTSFSERGSESSAESTDSRPLMTNSASSERRPVSSPEKYNKKIRTLATLLPDELLYDPFKRKARPYSAALMFPDVSGFTLLCEKYDKTGKGGPSRLTEVLNGYIGSMIKIVISRNGDVCKFGGDAFLCVWKVTEGSNIKEIVQSAIDSAVDIQKKCGETKTDVGVNLGVKIAVSAGKVLFSIIGSETRKYYVVVGSPLMEVRDAERLCKQGDVIVAPSAWKHIQNYMFYSYTYHSDNSHIKVHDFGPLWKSTIPKSKDVETSEDPFLFRPAMKNTFHLKIEDIKPFILPPVLRSIDLNQGFDYLTEMRQVAILFINVIADFSQMTFEEIIELSNRAFQTVLGIVDKNDGSVNKLNLFDKDMAILVVFGLKGFKYELSSQVALKCAHNCVEQLKKLKVTSASAGVTTGMAYCGVIGHTLRREYTVMGHPVNVAARLMCAFINIVSSDRNTFLHSKLESGHFELLEQTFLKGIENPGPFYKFSLYPKRNKIKLDLKEYPLLGRTKEIKQFEQFLNDSKKKDNKSNFMVIYGNARIGKSRLIAKFINIAENFVFVDADLKKRPRDMSNRLEICVIPLTEDDSKSSHSASRLIFQYPLGLSESSSVEEREDKILSKLGEYKDIKFMASLNPIFNVNFDLLPQYLELSPKEQFDVQEVMVKNLYKKCFPKGTRWLIVLEDAEFMDEKSWDLLKWCVNVSNKVLFLITIGQRKTLTISALDCLESINPKKIFLKEIDKWFYAGLACQILGVRAIPVELVNLLQTYKSSGNPGWLESFLLSLTQSGCIVISQANSRQIKTMKLVSAPEDMVSIAKMTEEEKSSSTWLDYVGTFEPINTSDRYNVSVCLLGPKFFDAIENQAELTMDLMFIKTIDSLKPLEQLVLKAGSVLGNSFERTALKFVVATDMVVEERQFAKAIRNLFEIKIITCAKGDLTQFNLLAPRRMLLVTSMGREVNCECVGVVVPDDCRDLPHYASCGYMQFRSTSLRDTVYSLLLNDQKKKFHNSCIQFLRKNTYKCKSCNNVPFTNVFGTEVKEGQVNLVCTTSPMHGVRSTKLEPKKTLPIPSLKHQLVNCSFSLSSFIVSHKLQSFESEFGLIFHKEVVDCQCSQILSSVYSVLLEHAAGAGRKDLTLEIQLEYASVSLTSYNIPLTMQILEEALNLVEEMTAEKEYPEFCSPYIYGKIYTLMGATKLSMGRPDNAFDYLVAGLNFMEKDFPKSSTKVKLLIRKEIFKRKIMTEYFPHKYIGSASEEKAPLSDLVAECLALISLVYTYMKNRLMAKYASLWALNKALESNRNFYGLLVAYTNMMEISYYDNDVNTCAKMEICAIDICKRCTERINEVYELEAVCQLYRVIFQTRHARAEIEEAVLIGFQSIRISTIIRSTTLTLDLMPDLIFALIQLNRLSEAVSLLQELEFLSLLDSDKSSRIWYFAICLDFQLDTGYTVLPYETCQKFIKEEEENFVIVRDPDGKYRLYTSLWLWCLRFDEWELSKPYAKTLKSFQLVESRETPRSVFTRLKRLEGFLLTLVHKMDTRNIYSINATYAEIHSLMNKLDKDTKVVKLLKPRYLLLKAYYRQIRYRDENYVRLLSQAFSLADKMKDKNTSEWINLLKMVWGNTISPIQRDFWLEHCRNNLIYWHESEGVAKTQTVMFSFPLPKF